MPIRRDIQSILTELAQRSGLELGELSKRFHQIKSRGATPGPQDTNFIDDSNGDVYDGPAGVIGDYIGNVFNDF
jgi:hypothetical protein